MNIVETATNLEEKGEASQEDDWHHDLDNHAPDQEIGQGDPAEEDRKYAKLQWEYKAQKDKPNPFAS